jgi:V/A-type H+-transporting ATPase subunit I
MFGDLGHGLILLFGGLTVGYLIKGNRSMKNVCYIMAACGLGASVAGIVFGEAFGQPLPWGPLWINPTENPTVNVFTFIVFSLFVGVIQITSGIVLEMTNFALKHQYADALLTSGPKIAFYFGGVYLIAAYQLNFGAWLSGPILWPLLAFIVLVVGKPLYLKATKPAVPNGGEHAEQDTLSGRLFEGGDLVTRLLSNTISYSRILALLMAHWALLLVTYTVAGLVNPAGSTSVLAFAISGVVIVFGNIFVLALEGLIVFIHTLRLHFYEWFSKFYTGTGVEFHPFKQNFIYTKLKLKKTKIEN